MTEEISAAADDSPADFEFDDEEERASFGVPALAVNRFYGRITGSGVRLAFAERIPRTKTSKFRTAVTCSVADARELQVLLQYLLSRADQEASPETETDG